MVIDVKVHEVVSDGTFGPRYRLRAVFAVVAVYVGRHEATGEPVIHVAQAVNQRAYEELFRELQEQSLFVGSTAVYHLIDLDDLILNKVKYRAADHRKGWRVPSLNDHAFFNPYAEKGLEILRERSAENWEYATLDSMGDQINDYV